MKVLLIFSLVLIAVGGGESRRVTGYSGGGVLIRCRYETQYRSNPKYLCKGSPPNCADQIKTGVQNKWETSGRFSLFDNTRAAEFWVMIRELTVEDSGRYQCAVDISWGSDDYTPVELTVKKDLSSKKIISVVGHVGGGVTINCSYPQSLSSEPKFLCRRVDTADYNYTILVEDSRRWRNEGNFSLHDDKEQTFTVSINSLTEGNSGEYWCGAESDWTSDHGYKVYLTQINLRVTERPTAIPPPRPSTTVQSTESTSSSTVNSSFKTSEDSVTPPPASPASSIITGVSVILVLLLIGLYFFTVTLRKRSKTQDPDTTQRLRGPSSIHRASLPVYEEIEDNTQRSASGDSTVYSTIQSPTNISEPSHVVYGNIQLPSSCDFSNTVYSTSQLPSTDQGTYTTAQLPKRAVDDPTYSTPNFSKNVGGSTDSKLQ